MLQDKLIFIKTSGGVSRAFSREKFPYPEVGLEGGGTKCWLVGQMTSREKFILFLLIASEVGSRLEFKTKCKKEIFNRAKNTETFI